MPIATGIGFGPFLLDPSAAASKLLSCGEILRLHDPVDLRACRPTPSESPDSPAAPAPVSARASGVAIAACTFAGNFLYFSARSTARYGCFDRPDLLPHVVHPRCDVSEFALVRRRLFRRRQRMIHLDVSDHSDDCSL